MYSVKKIEKQIYLYISQTMFHQIIMITNNMIIYKHFITEKMRNRCNEQEQNYDHYEANC